MLFSKLANVQKATQKALKKQRGRHKAVNFEQAQQVALLYTTGHDPTLTLLKRLQQTLAQDGKQVSTMGLINSPQKGQTVPEGFFSPQDFSFFGSVKSPALQSFIGHSYHYLIHLDPHPTPYTQLVLALSKSQCRVGWGPESQDQVPTISPYYELILGTPPQLANTSQQQDHFFDQLFMYLKMIKVA